MKNLNKYLAVSALMVLFLVSCEEFVDIGLPSNQMVREDVFATDPTAQAAMDGLYFNLSQLSYFTSGSENSVTVICGLSSNELDDYNSATGAFGEFHIGEVSIGNTANSNLWSSAYNIIYMANSIIEGLDQPYSIAVTSSLKKKLVGEAKFIRAFAHFYLINLFGNIPLATSTDYRINGNAEQYPQGQIYEQIISDLEDAVKLLDNHYGINRTRPNKSAAKLMLARMHLYLQHWEVAEKLTSEVISENTIYELKDNLNAVFFANSKEAIWQIKPERQGYTYEGNLFILIQPPKRFALSENIVESFEDGDKRLANWIGQYDTGTGIYYYPYKYKVQTAIGEPVEYSMVLRFAEAYLIRAEARARQNKLKDAITDLDVIRGRAGIALLSDTHPRISQNDLLGFIMRERQLEFFTEWGHRWFDMIRTDKTTQILGAKNWMIKKFLFPIPETEIDKNPNLQQNEGYNQ